MKFIPVRDLRIRPGHVWKQLAGDELVVTSKGQPIALITRVTPATLERELAQIRKSRALAALEDIQRDAVRAGHDRLTDEDIDAEVKAARRARRR